MKPLIAFLFILAAFNLKAQNAAMTAGSESLIPGSQGQSITESSPDQTHYSTPPKEAVIQQGSISSHPEPKSTTSKDIIVMFAALLIATAVYFIFRKNSAKPPVEAPLIRMEDENEAELKKEIWEKAASDSDKEETK
jgi:hypothetical protein